MRVQHGVEKLPTTCEGAVTCVTTLGLGSSAYRLQWERRELRGEKKYIKTIDTMHEEAKVGSNTMLQGVVHEFFAGNAKVDDVVAAALEPCASSPAPMQCVLCTVDTPKSWARLMKLHEEALVAATLWCQLRVVGACVWVCALCRGEGTKRLVTLWCVLAVEPVGISELVARDIGNMSQAQHVELKHNPGTHVDIHYCPRCLVTCLTLS